MAVKNPFCIADYGPLQHSHRGDLQEIAGYGAGYGPLQRSHQGDHHEIVGIRQTKIPPSPKKSLFFGGGVSVLLSASVDRFGGSRMRDFNS